LKFYCVRVRRDSKSRQASFSDLPCVQFNDSLFPSKADVLHRLY